MTNRLSAALARWFPPNYVARNMPGLLNQRDVLGAMQIAYTVGKPQYPTRSAAVYDEEAYRKIALIFRCVNIIANAIGSAPLRVYQQVNGQPNELADHPMRTLLERPNPMMGEAVFWATVNTTLASSGFCVIEKVRARAGNVVELWPLRSDWLLSVPRSDGKTDWIYRVPGRQDVPIPNEDVLVTTWASTPTYRATGIGPLEVALNQWSLLNTMSDFLKAFFDGGAMPTYGLVLADGVTLKPEQAELIRNEWSQRYAGWRSGNVSPPILQTIKDIKRLSFDYNELAYIDLRDVSEIAVLQAFGIPGSLVGQHFAQERSTFSNYAEARKSFYQETIIPLWARLDDTFTLGLLNEFEHRPNVSLQFDTSNVDALQEDENAKWLRAQGALAASGITVNEFRREIGLADVSSGDVFLRGFNIIEVPSGTQKRAVRASVSVHEPRAITAGDRRARGLVALETRTRIETRAARLYTNAARKFTSPLMDFFVAQRNRVIDALEKTDERSIRAVADVININWSAEDDELDTIIRQLWDLMGEHAADDVTDVLGLTSEVHWDVANPWVREVLGEVATRVTSINTTTRNDIRVVVDNALAKGTTIDDLAAELGDLFDITYNGRAETVARTESQVAYNTANVRGYEESGLVSEVEYLDNAEHTDHYGAEDGLSCSERNGLISPIGDAPLHIRSEHPNGQLAVAPVIRDLGVV